MGAMLGHLVIYCFNITKMEVIFMRDSIDYSATDPISKAKKYISPNKLFEYFPAWKNDVIVYVVSVPLVCNPIAGVLDNTKEDDLVNNENYTVVAKQMQNEGRFFQDENYDVLKEPYIEEVTVVDKSQNTEKTYNYFDFTCLIKKE